MADPSELLAAARLLLDGEGGNPPTDAQLRRAVSTAYYAVFHCILRAAADRFMGPDKAASAGYALLYRSFDHRHMKTVCEALQASTLRGRFRRHLRKASVSQEVQEFAEIFGELQDARHAADYDPLASLVISDVMALIDSAAVAMRIFDQVAPDEKSDVLALLMVRARD